MPKTPATIKPTHCHKVGACQCSKAKGRLNKVTVIDCHITMTPGFSVRVRCLVMRNEAAKTGDEANITKLYQPPEPVRLGTTTTSTPKNPMPAAIQRSLRMGSPKNQAAPNMMKMGPVKPMAVMSASGICGNAMNHKMSPTVCTPPRQNWPLMSLGT